MVMPDEIRPIASIEEAIRALNQEVDVNMLQRQQYEERIADLHAIIGQLTEELRAAKGQLSELLHDRDFDVDPG